MRLFIAVEIPDDIKKYLGKIQGEFIDTHSNKIRSVNANNIHLTLKFLGEVQPNNVELIKENLKKIKFENFSVYLDKMGVFPSENYIRVIWVELISKKINELQEKIDKETRDFLKENKKFYSHITIARAKSIEDKPKLINEIKKIKFKKLDFKVNEFVLMKSELFPNGPKHKIIEKFELKN